MPLMPCAACQRHVYTTEIVCPFCQQELSSIAETPLVRANSTRMSRAALVALSISGVACDFKPEPVPVAIYGSPPTPTGYTSMSASSAGANSSTTGVAQGGSAGETSDGGGAAGEAGATSIGGASSLPGTGGAGAVPVYGAPPAPER